MYLNIPLVVVEEISISPELFLTVISSVSGLAIKILRMVML